jgi:hypothetical protein
MRKTTQIATVAPVQINKIERKVWAVAGRLSNREARLRQDTPGCNRSLADLLSIPPPDYFWLLPPGVVVWRRAILMPSERTSGCRRLPVQSRNVQTQVDTRELLIPQHFPARFRHPSTVWLI